MDSESHEVVFRDTVGFCTTEIIEPLIKNLFEWIDIDCFKVFTPELAELFEEKMSGYFAVDHKLFIGEFYYSALYGDPISTETLIEIIIDQRVSEEPINKSDNFEGLEIYFSDHLETLRQNIDTNGVLSENRVQIEYPSEIIIAKMINYLNSNRE